MRGRRASLTAESTCASASSIAVDSSGIQLETTARFLLCTPRVSTTSAMPTRSSERRYIGPPAATVAARNTAISTPIARKRSPRARRCTNRKKFKMKKYSEPEFKLLNNLNSSVHTGDHPQSIELVVPVGLPVSRILRAFSVHAVVRGTYLRGQPPTTSTLDRSRTKIDGLM